MRHEPSSGYEDPTLAYRVTWKTYDGDDEIHEQIFTNRDQGWDFYQGKQRSADAFAATWDHIPA